MAKLVPLLMASALLACPACKDRRRTLEGFVPNGATVMLSVDAQAWFAASDLDRAFMSELVGSDDVDRLAAEFESACGFDSKALLAVVVGIRHRPGDAPDDPGIFVALRGPRLGTKDTLECLAGVLGRAWEITGDGFELGEDEGLPMLEVAGGQLTMWGVDGATLVVANDEWVSDVRERVHGRGPTATSGNLRDQVGSIATDAPIWFAADLVGFPYAEGTAFAEAQQGWGTVWLDDGVMGKAEFSFVDDIAAAKSRRAVERRRVELVDGSDLPFTAAMARLIFEQSGSRLLVRTIWFDERR